MLYLKRLLSGLLCLVLLAGCASGPPKPAVPSGVPSIAQLTRQDGALKPYPIHNPLVATVAGTPNALQAKLPTDIKLSIRSLPSLVQRPVPPTLRYANPLRYLLAAQPGPAPLAFVIAGTGDTAMSSSCVLLSRALYQVGYSVVCLPSTTSVTFMLNAAKYPVPGRMQTDAADLYHLMQVVRDRLVKKHKLSITGYALAGWSLGATQAAFVAYRDRREHLFDFSRVLLLNPAVSVWTSVQRVDHLLYANLPGGVSQLPAFIAQTLGGLKRLYAQKQGLRFNTDFIYRAYKSGAATRRDIGAIIGLAFRLALANMAFAADQMTHAGVIVPSSVRLGEFDSLSRYFERSMRLSFNDYLDRLLVPYWNSGGRHVSREQIIQEADLRSIAGWLATDPHIAVFTNRDDPILAPGDIGFLRATFGKRARIRPYGGHLGNLDYAGTVHAIQEFFAR